MDARKLSRRKTPALVLCEYVSADPKSSLEVRAARLRLIEVAKCVYPRFLRTLSDEVFLLYEKLAMAGYDFDPILWSPEVSPFDMLRSRMRWQVQNPPSFPRKIGRTKARKEKELDSRIAAALELDDFTAYRNAMNLKESKTRNGWSWVPRSADHDNLTSALSKWASEFNVEDGWLMDDVLRTFRGWHVAPQRRESLWWNTYHVHSNTCPIGDKVGFHFNGWDTELFAWSAYRESLRRSFENKLAEYEKRTRELAESRGLVRARRKYSPENLEWFVLYQFAGQSSTAIARRLSGSRDDADSTVLKGIKAAAKLIGWGQLRSH
jgi:hypothetical protein